jgi:DNA repair protein RecN (Recombination protein N)
VSDEALQALAAQRDAAATEAAKLATGLSAHRTAAASGLAGLITGELRALAMPDARLLIDVRRRPPLAGGMALSVDGQEASAGQDGADEVEFLLQSHPDAPALPLTRGASGGELSRVMLAVEVCLRESNPAATMVFDEIDAGVGGRAAIEVGRRLARLGRDRQVLVVTHLAQVAAYADRHVVVDKVGASGVTRSDVRVIDGPRRIAELARMLAGTDSVTAHKHAAELLSLAADQRDGDQVTNGPGRSKRSKTSA